MVEGKNGEGEVHNMAVTGVSYDGMRIKVKKVG
jgi:hypothetical protein